MKENDTDNKIRQTPKPNPDLKNLEKLIGTWKVSGGLSGTNTFKWAESGFFLIQHFDLKQGGYRLNRIQR